MSQRACSPSSPAAPASPFPLPLCWRGGLVRHAQRATLLLKPPARRAHQAPQAAPAAVQPLAQHPDNAVPLLGGVGQQVEQRLVVGAVQLLAPALQRLQSQARPRA
jgi:hypothetical protein